MRCLFYPLAQGKQVLLDFNPVENSVTTSQEQGVTISYRQPFSWQDSLNLTKSNSQPTKPRVIPIISIPFVNKLQKRQSCFLVRLENSLSCSNWNHCKIG